jgi:hypothetical protein
LLFGLFGWFLCEIGETLDELFGEEGFVLMEAVALTAERCVFYILDFEFDGAGWDGRDADVEVCLHKIIITETISAISLLSTKRTSLFYLFLPSKLRIKFNTFVYL